MIARNTAYLARSPFDSALSGLAGSLAVFSMFMGVGKPVLAQFMAAGVIIATAIGYVLSQALRKSPMLRYDGWILTSVAGVLLFVTGPINASLGEEAIPVNLIAGFYFSLLLVVGSLVAWRDPTTLMLSVPCISLFAYVGVFDYWRPAIVLFFAFLIAIAVLYARAYLRVMVEKAQKLGAEPDLLRRDVWKWVAGPEWAFASAAVVIAVSLVAGPLLQVSLAPVSGAVKIPAPTQNPHQSTGTTLNAENRIGVGPVTLTDAPVFKVKAEEGGYFRRKVYFEYDGDGWNSGRTGLNLSSLLGAKKDPKGGTLIDNSRPSPYEAMTKARIEHYTIRMVDQNLSFLPEPGVFTHLDVDPIDIQLTGASVEVSSLRKAEPVSFDVDKPAVLPGDVKSTVPGAYPTVNPILTTDRVRQAALEATQGARTDYQKCMALVRYLGKQCRYNTQAAAVPAGKDKVDYFLFESQEGYCDLFATAFSVMARSIGVQTRYATGWFLPITDRKPEDGWYTVVEKDGHAWSEVYFRNVGWIQFDATAAAVNISPKQAKQGSERPKEAIRWDVVLNSFLALAGIAGVGLLIRALLRTNFAGRDPLSQLMKEQNRLQFAIESVVKHPRRFSQSITEFAHRHEAMLGDAAAPATELSKDFETAFFGGNQVTPELAADLKAKTSRVVKQLAEVKKALGRTRSR